MASRDVVAMMSETAFFVKDIMTPKGCVSIVMKEGAKSADMETHTKTSTIRTHWAQLDRDGQHERSTSMSAMRRVFGQIVLSIVAIAVVASLLVIPLEIGGTGQVRAAEGFSTQTLASVSAVESESQLVVQRVVIEPGVLLARYGYPGSATLVVVSGTLQTTLVQGGAAVSRGGNQQVAEIGQTMNLSAGQVVSYSPKAVMTAANLRSERLVMIVTVLVEGNEAVGMFSGLLPLGGAGTK